MRKICSGLQFPEGPIALANGDVLVVEIARGTLTRCRPDGSTAVVAELGGGPNGAALGPDGKVYVCNNGGFAWHTTDDGLLLPGHRPADYVGGSIQRVDLATGAVETLHTSCEGRPLRGPNDIVFDRHGGYYFTDLGKSTEDGRDFGAIHYVDPNGAIHTVARPIMTPNGIGLSPDEDRLYYADTVAGRVMFWDIAEPGVVRSPVGAVYPATTVAAGLLANVGGAARLDSLAVDEEGNVCVATLVVGAVTAIAPDGRIRAIVPVPGGDPMVTNVCFGGPDRMTAFITASGKGDLYAHEWHCPGLALNFGEV